jgi:hypothetical protein
MDTRRRPFITAALTLLLLTALPATAWLQEQSGSPAQGTPEPTPQEAKPGELAIPDGGAPVSEPNATGQPEAAPGKKTDGTYTIKQADTLWDISNTFLKDPFLWPLIWKQNPYITNPDLIYPGNLLVIPSLAPIERAMEEAEPTREVARPEKPEAPVVREAPPELPFMGKRVITEKPIEEEEEAPAGSRLILPEEIAPPLIDKYAMLYAGFVAPNDVSRDRVVGGLDPKSMFSFDDIILVKMHSPDEVNVGDKLLIYEPHKRVRHPATGKDFGKLTKVLGVLQVTAKEPSGIVSGKVTISFDAIEKGSLVTTYEEPVLVYPSSETKAKDIAGYILEVRDTRTLNGQIDVVYLDKGSLDGVEPGDRFTVYLEPRVKGYPNKVIGEVQVFLVKDRSATAVVKKSTDAMARGDRITYKQ